MRNPFDIGMVYAPYVPLTFANHELPMDAPVTFLLQNNMRPSSIERMVVPVLDYARAHGHLIYDASMTSDFDPDKIPEEYRDPFHKLIVFGSVAWTKVFFQSKYFRKTIGYSVHSFHANTWANHFLHKWVNSNGVELLANEVHKHLETPKHLRPVFEDKAFNGAVYDYDKWQAMTKEKELDADLRVWASKPTTFQAEFRCWICNGNVIEISQYRRDGVFETRRITDHQVFAAAEFLYASCPTQRNVVMDIVLIDGEYKFLEYNPIHGSGWYAADVPNILDHWIAAKHTF